MLYYNHILLAFELFLFVLVFICSPSISWLEAHIFSLFFFLLGLILGSILPDADHSESYVSKNYPLLSKLFRVFVILISILVYPIAKLFNRRLTFSKLKSHRGLAHSLIVPILIFVAVALFQRFYTLPGFLLLFFAGLIFGYISHLIGDLFTVQGVPLLLPFSKKRYSIPLFSTGSMKEHLFVLTILLLEIALMVKGWNLESSRSTLMHWFVSLKTWVGSV